MQNETSRLITIPNILTLIRIFLVPVFVITYYEYPDARYISMCVFILASLTDGVDGYLARRLNQITSFGKLCDPLADKLMIVSMMFCLGRTGLLAPQKPAWLNSVVLYAVLTKEILMVLGGLFMLKKGFVVHSNIFGKIATAAFCLAIVLVFPTNGTLPWHGVGRLQLIGRWLMLAATLSTFVAFVVYLFDSAAKLRGKKPANA